MSRVRIRSKSAGDCRGDRASRSFVEPHVRMSGWISGARSRRKMSLSFTGQG